MIYRIGVNKYYSAWVETWDDQIIVTSAAFAWARGRSIGWLLDWLYSREILWKEEK